MNNSEIKQEKIKEQISNIFKDKCIRLLQKKFDTTSKNHLKEQIEDALKEAYKDTIIYDYKIKRTKLPRKLKKKYKKEQRICFDIEYRQPQGIEFTIPVEK